MSRIASILIVALVAASTMNRLPGQEPQKAQKQVDEKKGAVDAAAARLAGAQAKRNEAEAILVQYKAAVDRFQVNADRIRGEVENGVVDRCVLEEIERQLRSSIAESKAAEAVLAIAEKEVAAEKDRLDQAGAELGQAIEKQISDRKAAVDAASARLAKVQAKRDTAAEELDQYKAMVERWQIQAERLRLEKENGVVEPAVRTDPGRQLRNVQAEFKKAQADFAIIEKEVAVEKARVNLARAELDLVQAKLQPAEQEQPKNEDAVKKLLKTQIEAAKKAYRASADGLVQIKQLGRKGDIFMPSATHGDVHLWSVRWLDAQRDLSQTKDERTAAFAEHCKRMEKLQRVIAANKEMFEGADQAAGQWYVAEAELWLLKEQGKNGK